MKSVVNRKTVMRDTSMMMRMRVAMHGPTQAEQRAQADKEYNENYEFSKNHSPRSSVSKREHEWATKEMLINKDDPSFNANVKERALLQGTSHSFGHTGTQKQGKLRISGAKGAHQIGKRK